MIIKTIQRIYDDFGNEIAEGDSVLVQTKDTDGQVVQATVGAIMTSIAEFMIDDRALGFIKIKARPKDVISIELYAKKPVERKQDKKKAKRK